MYHSIILFIVVIKVELSCSYRRLFMLFLTKFRTCRHGSMLLVHLVAKVDVHNVSIRKVMFF